MYNGSKFIHITYLSNIVTNGLFFENIVFILLCIGCILNMWGHTRQASSTQAPQNIIMNKSQLGESASTIFFPHVNCVHMQILC